MRPATKQGMSASCGCTHTGSKSVFIEGRGAVRSRGPDSAGGQIQGGVSSVRIGGDPISVEGDPIVPHLKGRHKSGPNTANGSRTVLVGGGGEQSPKAGEEGELYASLGGVYKVAVAADPYKPLIDRLNRLRRAYKQPPLSAEQIKIIRSAKGPYLKQLQNTISRLEKADHERRTIGTPSGYGYMSGVMNDAAKTAEWYGLTPVDEGRLFLSLLDASFASPPSNAPDGYWQVELPRQWLRTGGKPSPQGQLIEGTAELIFKQNANEGFTAWVTDVNPSSDVHHHWNELAIAGANSGGQFAVLAQKILDDPNVNPGDVNNGIIAGMIGDALWRGALSPTNATKLSDWMNKKDTTAPWSSTNRELLLPKMVAEYNMQHPENPIPPIGGNYPTYTRKLPWPFG